MNPILIGAGGLALLVWALSGKDDKADKSGVKADVSQTDDTEDAGKELRPTQRQTLPPSPPPKKTVADISDDDIDVGVDFVDAGAAIHEVGRDVDIEGNVGGVSATAGHDHGWDDVHPGKYGDDGVSGGGPGGGGNPNSGKPIGSREIDQRVARALSAGFASGLAI